MFLRDQKGQALLFVVLMTSLILVLATGALAVAGAHRRNVRFQEQQVQVYYIAEAGLERALARMREEPDWLDGVPSGGSVRMAEVEGPYAGGEISEVTLQKNPEGMGLRVDLTSVGKFIGAQKTLRASLYLVNTRSLLGGLSLLPESTMDLDIKGKFSLEGTGESTPRLLLNGDLHLSGSASIEGDVYVSGEVVGRDRVTGQIHSGLQDLPEFPAIDLTYYEGQARQQGQYYGGDLSWSGTIPLNGVYYVQGEANLSGTYYGRGVIVVEGDVTISGDLLPGSEGDALAVICLGDVDMENNTVNATIITEGTLFLRGNAEVEGAVLARGISFGQKGKKDKSEGDEEKITGNVTIRYNDEGIPQDLLMGVVTELKILSWEEAHPIF
ncbi:MAG: hypothetical protein IMW96_07020 [Thermoanaerobacteraceae bacterium]|nr:hypothetical protein [Thermoanaerobacteraceae bacterium]